MLPQPDKWANFFGNVSVSSAKPTCSAMLVQTLGRQQEVTDAISPREAFRATPVQLHNN